MSGNSSQYAIHPEILSALVGPKKIEMLQLIHRFKTHQIQVQEFLSNCRILLGPRLYGQLAENMNKINAESRLQHQKQNRPISMTPENLLAPGIKALSDALVDKNTPRRMEPQKPQISDDTQHEQNDAGKPMTVDTDVLQDILQGSGVDLKEEADNILKEQEYLLTQVPVLQSTTEDPRSSLEFLFNVDKLMHITRLIAEKHGLHNAKSIDISVYEALLSGLKSRIGTMLDDIVLTSRNRVDILRSHFKMKIENDPRRQLAILECCLYNQQEKSLSGSKDGRTEKRDEDNQEESATKRSRPGASGSTSKSTGLEKEEQYVKTRLTNITALGQLGAPIKPWMASGSPITASSSTINGTSNINSTSGSAVIQHRAREKEWRASLMDRRITLRDLIFYMERDSDLFRSSLLAQAYMFLK